MLSEEKLAALRAAIPDSSAQLIAIEDPLRHADPKLFYAQEIRKHLDNPSSAVTVFIIDFSYHTFIQGHHVLVAFNRNRQGVVIDPLDYLSTTVYGEHLNFDQVGLACNFLSGRFVSPESSVDEKERVFECILHNLAELRDEFLPQITFEDLQVALSQRDPKGCEKVASIAPTEPYQGVQNNLSQEMN